MPLHSLGYLRLETTDLDSWKIFAEDFLGLMPVSQNENELRYRIDRYPARLTVTHGSENKMSAMGFEVYNSHDLEDLLSKVEAAGIKVSVGTESEAADRKVTGFAGFDDPAGNRVELFYGPILDHRPVVLPEVTGGFVTGDMGMGHVIVTGENGQALFDFYNGVLGFVERNTMRGQGGGTTWFLGCNPRHHTLGIASAPGPGRLLHFMFEAATLDDVGKAIDRADKYEVPIMNTLGKHTNDEMISFYVWSPERYAVEFGLGGLRIETPEPTYEITAGAYWGHKFSPPPPSAS
jgi:3,4-dihydroxy-9,10-secoandrosta-1,3,5(10)-triene-9,17-dione 4,5-dioxygenase